MTAPSSGSHINGEVEAALADRPLFSPPRSRVQKRVGIAALWKKRIYFFIGSPSAMNPRLLLVRPHLTPHPLPAPSPDWHDFDSERKSTR